jgi:hypothetical protein
VEPHQAEDQVSPHSVKKKMQFAATNVATNVAVSEMSSHNLFLQESSLQPPQTFSNRIICKPRCMDWNPATHSTRGTNWKPCSHSQEKFFCLVQTKSKDVGIKNARFTADQPHSSIVCHNLKFIRGSKNIFFNLHLLRTQARIIPVSDQSFFVIQGSSFNQ